VVVIHKLHIGVGRELTKLAMAFSPLPEVVVSLNWDVAWAAEYLKSSLWF
jgi:hypothetical protein